MLLPVFQILWPLCREFAFVYVLVLVHLGKESRSAWEMMHYVSHSPSPLTLSVTCDSLIMDGWLL